MAWQHHLRVELTEASFFAAFSILDCKKELVSSVSCILGLQSRFDDIVFSSMLLDFLQSSFSLFIRISLSSHVITHLLLSIAAEKRQAESARIREKYPERIPVSDICKKQVILHLRLNSLHCL